MTGDIKDDNSHLSHPVEAIRPSQMRGFANLTKAYERMSFQARSLGRAATLLSRMHRNEKVTVVMTLAGAMVPGGLQQTVCDAIEHRLIDVVVSTGANMSHDLVEGMGFKHYRHCNLHSDAELKEAYIDRIYDTFLSEEAFRETSFRIEKHLDLLQGNTSDAITRFLGSIAEKRCILKSAFEHNVPIFIPALNDSELGITLNRCNASRAQGEKIVWDGLEDNLRFARIIESAESCGILICGGGVPKNWAQQVTPLLEYLHLVPGQWDHKFDGYSYGITITTDTPVYGGLSGCTFSESLSWGKYADDYEHVTVNCDTTIALPLIIGAAIEQAGTSVSSVL